MTHSFRCNGTRLQTTIVLLLLWMPLPVQAQDGKLVQSSPINLENAKPYARAILDKVEIRSITYLRTASK